jgi:predicted acyl esterase
MIPWEGFGEPYAEALRHGGIAQTGFLDWWWNFSLKGNQYGYQHPEEKPGRPATEEGVLAEEELARNRVDISARNAGAPFRDDGYQLGREWELEQITTPLLSVANWVNLFLCRCCE